MPIIYQDFNYSPEDLILFQQQREQFYEALRELYISLQPNPQYVGAFEVPGTKGQSNSALWGILRCLLGTASVSHRICHMKSPSSYINFLRSHLWKMDQIQTRAMAYGIKHESKAREAYKTKKRLEDSSVNVEETGLHLHTEFMGVGCSFDGIVTATKQKRKTLEIKILYKLRGKNPNDYHTILNKKQLSRFPLAKDESGTDYLKANHPYYDQVQLQMGMMEDIDECDFFLWTQHGSIIVPVTFDVDRWTTLRNGLLQFHREVLVPDYFAMRAPRKLTPITLT